MPNELQHFGVLGMKWGVRRDRGSDGRASSGRKQTSDERIITKRRADVKNRRQLSDDALIKKIARLEREKKLRELTDAEINAGKKATQDIMKSVGTKVATTVLTGAVLYGVKAFLTGKIDVQDLAGYLTPKPGKK